MNISKQLMKYNFTSLPRSKDNINWIVCHYLGALGSAQNNADYYGNNNVGASADFFIGHIGEIIQTNDYYKGYSWHCGGGNSGKYFGICKNSNSVGIEMCVRKRSTATMNASDRDWYFEDATVNACAELVASKMKELNIDINHVIRHYDVNYKECPAPYVQNEALWTEFKAKVLGFYTGATIPPVSVEYYRVGIGWKDGKCITQTGAYTSKDNAISSCSSGYKVFDPKGKVVYTASSQRGTQPLDFTNLTESQTAAKILELAKADYNKTGVLSSVTAAQMILESGYVKTDLAVHACNCFGMKTTLSNNDWSGTSWDGKSKFTKVTNEEYTPGVITKVTADFRKYPCIEDSIADHSAYLLGAKNGTKLRYAGLKGETDYRKAITIIKNGGYATDSKYIDKICNIIERFGLDKYDGNSSTPMPSPAPETSLKYKVGQYVNCSSYYNKANDDAAKAIIKALSGTITKVNAKKHNPYQIDGKYWCNDGDIRSVGKTETFKQYSVKVNSTDLRIRSGAGTTYVSKGYTGKGTFTIVKEKQDSSGLKWGLLKSYEKKQDGWIALWLDCVKKI